MNVLRSLVALAVVLLLPVVAGCADPSVPASPPRPAVITGQGAHYSFALPDGFTDLRATEPGANEDTETYSLIAIGDPSAMDGIKVVETANAPGQQPYADDIARALADRLGVTVDAGKGALVAEKTAQVYGVTGKLSGRIILIQQSVTLSILCLSASQPEAVARGCDDVLASLHLRS